jgi:hypothetical protein
MRRYKDNDNGDDEPYSRRHLPTNLSVGLGLK